MVKRRAAPNPEAMMIAVRFAGGRRVDGEEEGEDGDEDGDEEEEVFMVFFFFFFFFLFYLSEFFSGELFVVVVLVVVAFLFCDGDSFFFLSFQKLGRSFCCLVGWLVAVFPFFGDFGGFLLALCYSYIHL